MSNKTTVSSRITTYLSGRKTKATTAQINNAIGGNVGTVAARLSDLVKSGTISRSTRKTAKRAIRVFSIA